MIFFQIFDFYAINSTVIFIIRIFGLFGFLFNLVILSLFKVTRVLLEYYSSNGYSSNGYSSNTFFVTLLGYSSNTFPVTLLEVSSNAFRYSSTTLVITNIFMTPYFKSSHCLTYLHHPVTLSTVHCYMYIIMPKKEQLLTIGGRNSR